MCTRDYNSLCDLTRQHEVWRKIKLSRVVRFSEHRFFSMYQTKFDTKMTKMKWNYTANMIMNVSETVCQFIHYFPNKQGLAIRLPCPALKSKQCTSKYKLIWKHECTPPPHCPIFKLFEAIWNNYIEIQWKSMQIRLIMLLWLQGYNFLGDPIDWSADISFFWWTTLTIF